MDSKRCRIDVYNQQFIDCCTQIIHSENGAQQAIAQAMSESKQHIDRLSAHLAEDAKQIRRVASQLRRDQDQLSSDVWGKAFYDSFENSNEGIFERVVDAYVDARYTQDIANDAIQVGLDQHQLAGYKNCEALDRRALSDQRARLRHEQETYDEKKRNNKKSSK